MIWLSYCQQCKWNITQSIKSELSINIIIKERSPGYKPENLPKYRDWEKFARQSNGSFFHLAMHVLELRQVLG